MAINLGKNELPNQWIISELPEFTHIVMGQSPSSETYNFDGIGLPFFQGKAEFGTIYPTISKYCSVPNKIADEGATLLSVRAPVGPTNLANIRCCIGRGLAAIHPMGGMDPKFILLLFRSIEPNLSGEGTGSTFSAITKTFVDDLKFAIPPINEQKRIVAKIEELFSELDNGIATLKTVREQLKIYRQSVLKHAFQGKLTAKWREENADKLESPDQLITRIQQEREVRFQQQLEDWETAVKEWEANDKDGKKPVKPKEFVKQGEVGLGSELVFDIPETWKSMLMGHVFSVHVGSTPSRTKNEFWNGDIFWVSSGEVAFCEINKTAETITAEGYENTSTEIHQEGTVLLAMIGEGKTRGQAAILRVPAAHNQNTAAIRVSEIDLQPEYIYYFLQYQYEQTRRVGSGNNQKALNKNRVASIQFPLCSIQEQIVIVQLLSEKLSFVESLDNELNIQLAKAKKLRLSILKKAFSGQLVSQNSNDEPASELLARIQAEKHITSPCRPQKTRKTRSTLGH
ncbi:type I restriction endonuclease subunit S [Enterobacter sp. Cy-643]|uniref:restriction endonuclease subunit S n=1 Tax=Enterobacter sp. Cy-643 TaxID=2608346 RepID=UPI00141F7292|nr:restriction endonuclease subunit S [Enterobacter sp. Cy-643]NIF34374.1 type I restriction endonuclease subunit S [Enterobacter sp. Cy-643]